MSTHQQFRVTAFTPTRVGRGGGAHRTHHHFGNVGVLASTGAHHARQTYSSARAPSRRGSLRQSGTGDLWCQLSCSRAAQSFRVRFIADVSLRWCHGSSPCTHSSRPAFFHRSSRVFRFCRRRGCGSYCRAPLQRSLSSRWPCREARSLKCVACPPGTQRRPGLKDRLATRPSVRQSVASRARERPGTRRTLEVEWTDDYDSTIGQPAHIATHPIVFEPVETYFYRPLRAGAVKVSRVAKRLQSGHLNAYVAYMLIAVLAALAIVSGIK